MYFVIVFLPAGVVAGLLVCAFMFILFFILFYFFHAHVCHKASPYLLYTQPRTRPV